MGKLQVIYKRPDDIIPYDRNPRNNDNAVDAVANSIREFGFKVPVVIDKDGVIVCGHTRVKAAKKLIAKGEVDWEEIPCIMADDLNDEQIKAFRLADNKTSELSEWDETLLALEMDDIFNIDLEQFGFTTIEEELEEEEEEKPEVEFTEVLGEENNYLVLKFNTEVDWLQALSVFDIKQVKALSTRKDGKVTEKMMRIGVGRVLDGAVALNKLVGGV